LEYGPGFSVRGMRVDQVTGQLTVGQLASRTGVRADTVRYYEREGLLPVPQRTEGEHRRYGRDDVDRLLFIRGAQRLGVRLAEIRELLAIRDTGVCACEPAEGLLRRQRRRDRDGDGAAGGAAGRATRHAGGYAGSRLPRPAARDLVAARPFTTGKEVTAMCPCCGDCTCDGSCCDVECC